MYRILIVDDEPAIVNGLSIMLSKHDEMELDILKAFSSVDALEIVRKMRVDILLSDIRMPVITGLQLREKTLECWPDCKTIFLTGYNEFEYVYEAIQKTDTKYILKTENNDVLLKAVFDAITKLNMEKAQLDIVNEAKRKMADLNQLFRKELMESLLNGDNDDISSIAQQFEALDMSLNTCDPILLVLGKLNEINPEVKQNEKIEIYCAVQNMLEKSFMPDVVHTNTVIAKSEIVFFIQPVNSSFSNSSTYLKGILESVQDNFKETYNVSLSFIISRKFADLSSLHEEYEIMQLIGKRLLKGAQLLIDLSEADAKSLVTSKVLVEDTDNCGFNKMLRKLDKVLEDSYDLEVPGLLSELLGIVKKNFALSYFAGVEKYYSLLMVYVSFINRHNLSNSLNLDLEIEKLIVLDLADDWEKTEKYLVGLGHYLCMYIREKSAHESDLVIARLQSYIRQNPGGDLSLTKLADSVYFNPSYLSRYYKQVTGQNLSDFINSVKIEIAKRRLEDTHFKIDEIALELGFEITSYFTTFFKRLTGMTPRDYRNALIK